MTHKPQARAKTAKPRPSETTPEETTSVVPGLGYDNHSFILQAIMENQKALGRLEKAIEGVQADIKDINDTVHKHTITLALATGALIVISVIGGFLINAAWEKAVDVMNLDVPAIEYAIERSKSSAGSSVPTDLMSP